MGGEGERGGGQRIVKYLLKSMMVTLFLVLVLVVLVLIKDDLFIKRMLAQKASVYPGFILMSVIII